MAYQDAIYSDPLISGQWHPDEMFSDYQQANMFREYVRACWFADKNGKLETVEGKFPETIGWLRDRMAEARAHGWHTKGIDDGGAIIWTPTAKSQVQQYAEKIPLMPYGTKEDRLRCHEAGRVQITRRVEYGFTDILGAQLKNEQ